MPILANYPLSETFIGPDITLQAQGLNVMGSTYPSGILGSIEIVKGVARLTVRETDAPTYGERRSEILFNSQLDPTGERWYAWEFMIPSSWGKEDRGFAIMQIHESSGEPVAVQFNLHLENNQLVARVPVDVTMLSTDSYRAGTYPFSFDRWYFMCFRANWQLDASGFWELYVDRIPLLKRFGFANAYNREFGGYLKLGIYNFNKLSGWGTKVIYIRNVNIWSGNDGYQAIMGGLPVPPPRLLRQT